MQKNIGLTAGVVALIAMVAHISGPLAPDQPSGVPSARASAEGGAVAGNPEKGGGESSDERRDKQYLEGPWIATRDFLYSQPKEVPAGPDGKALDFFDVAAISQCARDASCRQGIQRFFGLEQGGAAYDFLLATVADPMRTRLGLTTDDAINAIEEAAGNNGLEFAGQWLPWHAGPKPSEADPEKRGEASVGTRLQEVQPGILIFRCQPSKKDGAQKALFVLLVGETPTAGINGLQFKMARAYMEALGKPDRVRLLSPSFSGSFSSLSELIAQDQSTYSRDKSKYVVRSGTATSDSGGQMLRAVAPDFEGANESLADQQQHFQELLDYMHIQPDQAAYLIEGESGFGNAFANANAKANAKAGGRKIRLIRFPREISHLRNAYRDAVTQTNGQNAPTPDLNFSLKDIGGGEDGVPVFSETQTPLSQNAVMQEIANEIRRDRIRIVQAGATNVLDLLFVAKVIREQCPDTRLVVAFPDLLFVQALQTEPLDGVLALSTYPLFFERESWLNDPKLGTTFPDMNAEGMYNAATLLMGDSSESKLEDYGWQELHRPPAWLMLLDHAGFSPVRVFTDSGNAAWFAPGGATSTNLTFPLPSHPWVFIALIFAGCSLALCWLIVHQARTPACRILEVFAPDPGALADSARLFFLFAILLLLTFAQLVLYLPWAFHSAERPVYLLQGLLLAGSLCSAATAAWIARTCLWRSKLSRIRVTVTLTTTLVLAGIGAWSYCAGPRSSDGFFFSFRSVEMQLGSSPMLPILAAVAALLIFSGVHLKRFQLVARQRPSIYTSTFDGPLQGALRKSRREMNRILALPCGLKLKKIVWQVLIGAVALVLAFAALQIRVNLSSIDGRTYDVLCISLQLAVLAALLLTCWQIRAAWSWFHTFLNSLKALPIANAFTRVTEAGHSGPIWTRRLNLLSLDIPMESAKTLHDMRLIAEKAPETIGAITAAEVELWHCRYRHALRELLKAETTEPPLSRSQVARRFFHLKYLGASISNRISKQVLLPYWVENPLIAAESAGENRTKKKEPPKPPSFQDLAQRFVGYHYSCFLLYHVRHILNLIWFLSLGFVLLVLSLNSYDFQSPQQIGRFLIALFVLVSYVAWRCLAGMERNAILSRVLGTDAGELNKGFYLKLVSYGALPAIGLLASQFPAISKFLFAWVEPALEALK